MTKNTQQNSLLYALTGFLLGGFLVWAIMSTSINNNYVPMMQMMGIGNRGMIGDQTDITRLESASDFDRAFVEEMIPHHQMAVMMASMLKNGTSRPEMKGLAGTIIEAQTNEIDQMRQWLRTW